MQDVWTSLSATLVHHQNRKIDISLIGAPGPFLSALRRPVEGRFAALSNRHKTFKLRCDDEAQVNL
ncbi:hypothetical protein A1D17_21705 [Pseudomonas fluorescens]|uniref:Uncharacterized protein n=1 Tax=Pseudomonas fluorescens TaxID=294 RepID=A0A162AX67_PSEFL|nr:hypothetical protein A1D17_21705 [Pseudomonas fluorescens]